MNLGWLLFKQPYELVVLLDGFERLDIDCLPRRTRPVHHARDTPFKLAAHGNDESIAANGDDIILCRSIRKSLRKRTAASSMTPL